MNAPFQPPAVERSNLREVRNPVLAHPAARRLQSLDPSVRLMLRDLFREIALDARERAAEAWARHKAPMAVYWKAVSVYSGHIAKVLNK